MSNKTENTTEKTCGTCMFHNDFSWACCNGDSPYVAEFMDDRNSCGYWKLNWRELEKNDDDYFFRAHPYK